MTRIVENIPVTTRRGGVTGKGFLPGRSGNPGGRPKGLAKRVREAVGDDGALIVEVMVGVLTDEGARHADRVEAAKWLADRGFGKAAQTVEIEVAPQPAIDFTGYSTEDLRTLIGIMDKYAPDKTIDR